MPWTVNTARKWPRPVRVAVVVALALAGWAVLLSPVLAASAPPELQRVNAEVNRSIAYRAEADPTRDVVQFGPAFGDCEDYAVTKRLKLIARGWPKRALSVESVAVTRDGSCHAVLVAVDPRGTRWVLDNRTAYVETVEQTGRRYDWRGC